MKKAVIYARYSSEKQNEQSIEGQLRICENFAKDNDYLIVEKYIDRAMTGMNDHRPAFQQMLKDSESHNFEFVIVYKLDRFARNRYDSAFNKQKLSKNGVRVLSAMEQITDSPEGVILESVIEGMNEYYSRELSQKVKRGKYETIQKKNFVGGFIPFGYFVQDKKLKIDPEKQSIVKFIFDSYINGTQIVDIINELNSKGCKNSTGNKFIKDNIIKILKNPVYIGTLKHGEYNIENYYPAIIDKETYSTAQQKIATKKHRPALYKANVDYLLSGKLYCGQCGSLMGGESGTARSGDIYYYYKCSNRKKMGHCAQNSVKKEAAESFIVSVTLKYIYDNDFYKEVIDTALQEQELNIDKDIVLKNLNTQLKNSKKQLNNLINALKEGIYTSSTKQAILELEEDIKMYEDQIAITEAKMPPQLTRDLLEFWFEKFKNCKTDDKESCKLLINSFVHKIILYPQKIVIIFNHSGQNKKEFTIKDYENYIKKLEPENGSNLDVTGGTSATKFEPLTPRWIILDHFSILEIPLQHDKNIWPKKQRK